MIQLFAGKSGNLFGFLVLMVLEAVFDHRFIWTSLSTEHSTIVPNCRGCLIVSKYPCQANLDSGRMRILDN